MRRKLQIARCTYCCGPLPDSQVDYLGNRMAYKKEQGHNEAKTLGCLMGRLKEMWRRIKDICLLVDKRPKSEAVERLAYINDSLRNAKPRIQPEGCNDRELPCTVVKGRRASRNSYREQRLPHNPSQASSASYKYLRMFLVLFR